MAVDVQADNKPVVVGYFSTLSGFARNTIVRLNTDGSVDAVFDVSKRESSRDEKVLTMSLRRIEGGSHRRQAVLFNVPSVSELLPKRKRRQKLTEPGGANSAGVLTLCCAKYHAPSHHSAAWMPLLSELFLT